MIIAGILLLFFLGNISAEEINLQAGDFYTFDLEETYEYYTIEGNKTQVNLNITQNGTIVTITTNKYMQPDSFEITFFDKEGEVIDTYSVGGGRARSRVCYEEWQCGSWSECINEKQTRICTDLNYCETINHKPVTSKVCISEGEEEETLITEEAPAGFFATITGAVVDTLGTGGTIFAIVFVLLVVALAVFFSVKGRKK